MSVHTRAGDMIIGEIVGYEASKISKPFLITRSGRHRGLRGKLYNAKCVIQKPIRIKRA